MRYRPCSLASIVIVRWSKKYQLSTVRLIRTSPDSLRVVRTDTSSLPAGVVTRRIGVIELEAVNGVVTDV